MFAQVAKRAERTACDACVLHGCRDPFVCMSLMTGSFDGRNLPVCFECKIHHRLNSMRLPEALAGSQLKRLASGSDDDPQSRDSTSTGHSESKGKVATMGLKSSSPLVSRAHHQSSPPVVAVGSGCPRVGVVGRWTCHQGVHPGWPPALARKCLCAANSPPGFKLRHRRRPATQVRGPARQSEPGLRRVLGLVSLRTDHVTGFEDT